MQSLTAHSDSGSCCAVVVRDSQTHRFGTCTPKITSSVPVLTLSHTQCKKIQSPAICATLSKMHLNRHTARAIVYGPACFVGLDFPELYTSAGIGQLRLFLGHLRLQDKTANLILIDLSYLQLLVGSAMFFLNVPYVNYGHSTDGGWLVSIWQYINKIGFQMYVKRAYVPPLPRQHDAALMDYFVQKRIPPKVTVLWRGAGPSVGHPEAMTAYRAELCGLTSAFFLLLWVCNESDIQHGNAVIYCDNETALNEVFKNPLTTNNPYAYLAADIDLITCARDLLLQLPFEVQLKKEWVKAHYKGEKQLKHNLNDMADKLAVTFNSKRRPPATSNVYSPLSEAKILLDSAPITSQLRKIILAISHAPDLQQHIIKSSNWEERTFQLVDWRAHKKAFNKYNRVQRIKITKLAHGLYQTKAR